MAKDGTFPVTVSRLDAAWSVLYQLEQAGYQAYLVGGCVRDMLLGISPDDYDIATDALPDKVLNLFPKTVPTGIRHGTVSVLIGGERIEVTTFRTEGDYLDSRRPSHVKYVKSLKDDLSRRDFTINAMAMDRHGTMHDPFDGKKDLQNKIIRSVGLADQRFLEDALRMLRTIRFAAGLNAKIEEQTWQGIERNAKRMSMISRERIRDEWNKIVRSDLFTGMKYLTESTLIQNVFPDLVHVSSIKMLQAAEFANRLPEKLDLRHAALFWELSIGEIGVQKSLRQLRQSNSFIRSVTSILRAIPDMHPLNWTDETWRRYLYYHGKDILLDAMLILGQTRPEDEEKIMNQLHESIKKQPIWSIRDLAVTGQDLIEELQISSGPIIGQIREQLIRLILENPACNSRGYLISAAEDLYQKLAESSKKE